MIKTEQESVLLVVDCLEEDPECVIPVFMARFPAFYETPNSLVNCHDGTFETTIPYGLYLQMRSQILGIGFPYEVLDPATHLTVDEI